METVVFLFFLKLCVDYKLVCLLYELKKRHHRKKRRPVPFKERIFYFNRANASLMRRIASIIFSSEVA